MNVPFRKFSEKFPVLPIAVLLLGLVLGGCYQDYGLTVQDYDVYLTKYVGGTNFQGYKYFIMPDTIMHIFQGANNPVDPIKAARKYDSQILSLTASNLQARGYVRLKDTLAIRPGNMRDSVLIVLIGQFATDHTGYYYDYWYGYWGGYYPYYGYPPAYATTYEYTVGTNVTEILDFGKSSAGNKPVPLWFGTVSGLTGNSTSAQQRIGYGINAIFTQSPYLYAGQ